MFTCNSYLNDMITYRASHCSLSQVLFQFLAVLQILKLTWSLTLFSGKASWMSYMSFKKLCKSRKKSLFKEDDALVTSVANIQLELVKRVITDLTD